MNNITPNDIKNYIEKTFRELTPQTHEDVLIIESGLKIIKSFFSSKNSSVFMANNRSLSDKTLIQVFLNIIKALTEEQRDELENIMKNSSPLTHTVFQKIRKRVKE